MTAPIPPRPRPPLLPATFRGVSAVWLRRRLAEHVDLASAPADLARATGNEMAGRALAHSLAELDEACRQWEAREIRARQREAGSGSGTAEQPASTERARSRHELTTTEAAELLGVSEGLVRRWCRTERLIARRSGRSWLIDRGSAEDLLDARRGTTA